MAGWAKARLTPGPEPKNCSSAMFPHPALGARYRAYRNPAVGVTACRVLTPSVGAAPRVKRLTASLKSAAFAP